MVRIEKYKHFGGPNVQNIMVHICFFPCQGSANIWHEQEKSGLWDQIYFGDCVPQVFLCENVLYYAEFPILGL